MALTRATCRRRARAWKQGLVAACGLLLAPFTGAVPFASAASLQSFLPRVVNCLRLHANEFS